MFGLVYVKCLSTRLKSRHWCHWSHFWHRLHWRHFKYIA
nr:MAG TPA: hypothetical protein [Caudoviricetes sp.]